jgi:hypothetical protein
MGKRGRSRRRGKVILRAETSVYEGGRESNDTSHKRPKTHYQIMNYIFLQQLVRKRLFASIQCYPKIDTEKYI